MKSSIARVVLLVSAGLLVWAGCGKDKGNGPPEPKPYNQVFVEFFANPPFLTGSFQYEMWGKPIDTSLAAVTPAWKRLLRFNVDASGQLLDSNGAVTSTTIRNLPANLDDYDSIAITIERTDDNHTTPSQTIYLFGRIPPNLDSARIVELESPVPLSSAGGFCNLMTPTDSDTSNDLSGVWFVASDQPTPADSGLNIAPAPAGWRYEGWILHQDTWLSTGKFTRASGPDAANPYSAATLPAPAFPGEDFLLHAPTGINFTFPFAFGIGDRIVVTLEPEPDPAAGPFGITVVAVQFGGQPVPHTLVPLAGVPASIPGAFLTVKRSDGT